MLPFPVPLKYHHPQSVLTCQSYDGAFILYIIWLSLQLAMSAHDNATPIRILHNSAGHLSGPARSLGAILMGYIGKTITPALVEMNTFQMF